MKPKYTREKLDGTFVYPDCPDTINSKEDLLRWFEHVGQFETHNDREHLFKHLPEKYILRDEGSKIEMKFPRGRFSAILLFCDDECYKIAI